MIDNEFPAISGFEYNEEESIPENFKRLVQEQTELEKWSSQDPCLTFKSTQFVIIHFDVECNNMKIARIMYLLYWFMEEEYHRFPGDRKLEVIQTLG